MHRHEAEHCGFELLATDESFVLKIDGALNKRVYTMPVDTLKEAQRVAERLIKQWPDWPVVEG